MYNKMQNPRRSKNSKSGQSVIEFIFVILAFLNLLVVTINATMAFAVQQYMSYATFMAARAYQASNLTSAEQASAAEAVLKSYIFIHQADVAEKVFRFDKDGKGTARAVEFEIPRSDASSLPKYGQMPPEPGRRIRVSFKIPIFQLPFGGLSQGFAWVDLSAESYLGREPTSDECHSFFQNFYDFYTPKGKEDGWVGMDDNNC